jgi:hypothetical protein
MDMRCSGFFNIPNLHTTGIKYYKKEAVSRPPTDMHCTLSKKKSLFV